MTRLQVLCNMHNVQGGTIHEYNKEYNTDFILMSDLDFERFCLRYNKYQELLFKPVRPGLINDALWTGAHLYNLIKGDD